MSELITVDGAKYRKVDQAPKAGDMIYAIEDDHMCGDYKKGFLSTLFIDNGDLSFIDEVDDMRDFYGHGHEDNFMVVEKVTESLSDEISALKAKLTELEARVEAEKKQAEPERLKVGDYAKVVRGAENNLGMLVMIKGIEHDWARVDYLDDGRINKFSKIDFLTKVTPEEVAEVKAKLEAEKVKAAEEAKWAKIGRKVGEIRQGDIVRTFKEESGHPIGTIGVAKNGGKNTSISVVANGEDWLHKVELIAPVESVVNLSVQG